jgi:hypothetical protein
MIKYHQIVLYEIFLILNPLDLINEHKFQLYFVLEYLILTKKYD